MNSRVFSIINAIGCTVLVAFVIVQWVIGNGIERHLHEMEVQRINLTNDLLESREHANALETDIEGLKTSITSIREDAEAKAKELEARLTESDALHGGLVQAQDQVKVMDESIKARDEAIKTRDDKIKELGEALGATRKRLDEAVSKLKQAAKQ